VILLAVAAVVNVRGARAEIRDTRDPLAMARRGRVAGGAHAGRIDGVQRRLGCVPRAVLLRPAQRVRHRARSQVSTGFAAGAVEGLRPHYIGAGEASGAVIRERFGTDNVVARNDSTDFLDAAKASGEFDTVYSDDYASVLRVR